jgi:RNA-directed DNA polymerase
MYQLSLFNKPPKQIPKIALEDLFEAYYSCRHNKRNTANAIAFEIDYESNLIQLCNEINNGTYQIGRSIAFIVNKPVKREIFAADFRDRIVHHLIINKLNPLFEKEFINDSFGCRINRGTHFGIKRVDTFIRKCSQNYTQDCYVLKLDIQGFFMHIDKNILWQKLEVFINTNYHDTDKHLILNLTKQIVFNNTTQNCIIKGKRSNWNGLPNNKSLFYSPPNCGLPIGNLTSQVFANFYMNTLDHHIKSELKLEYYGRYVDDFVIVHPSIAYVKALIPKLSTFLQNELQLTLHPKKIHLQHYKKGVKFIGAVILPNRIYIANRTKGNFYNAIAKQNKVVQNRKPTKAEQETLLSSLNSYLGIMKHYQSFNLRKQMVFKNKTGLSGYWFNHLYLSGGIAKFVLKNKPIKKRKRWVTMTKKASGKEGIPF